MKEFILPENYFFFDGKIAGNSKYFFSLIDKADLEQSINKTYFVKKQNDDWFYIGDTDWRVIAMCTDCNQNYDLFAFSEEGEAISLDTTKINSFTLKDFCKLDFTVRRAKSINGSIFVVTYGGIVFQKNGNNDWIFTQIPDLNVGGFIESIEIDINGTLYIVGLNSEVWKKKFDNWERVDIQTNIDLNDICRGIDGNMYICGSEGIILKGKNDKWEVVYSGVSDELWRITEYDGIIYVSSMNYLFELTNEGLIPSNLMNELNLDTYYNLESSREELLIVAERQAISYDGINFLRVY